MEVQKQTSTTMPANAQDHYEINQADLPLHCPLDGMSKWDSHPRVFLTLKDGHAKCPYCGAEYTLKD